MQRCGLLGGMRVAVCRNLLMREKRKGGGMAREVLKSGLDCPLCGSAGTAVAKEDSKGRPYIYGANCCNAQLFARNADQAQKMRRRYGIGGDAKGPAGASDDGAKKGFGLLIG
jgi:hypothetical protein